MKIQYFQDTDTLYIEFKAAEIAETRDLDENTLLDLDREGFQTSEDRCQTSAASA
jgi:uncharacterized protein YuzE